MTGVGLVGQPDVIEEREGAPVVGAVQFAGLGVPQERRAHHGVTVDEAGVDVAGGVVQL